MASRLSMPLTARILVVRSLPGLGDLLCSVPALRSLRAAYPFAEITWLGLPGTEWFGERFSHLIDSWLPFPGFPGIPEGWQGPQETVNFLQQIQAKTFDLTLQIHGSGVYINPFLTLLGGRLQAGFYLPGQYCPDDECFLPYPQGISEVERLLQLMAFLGLPPQNFYLEFPLEATEHQAGLELLAAHALPPGRFVCLHPGASCSDRRWPLSQFVEIAQWLTRQGYPVVLTGTAAEQHLTGQVKAAIGPTASSSVIDLAGQTSLASLAVLLQQSALLICNDTGISHLAAALQVPSVVVFSGSELQRWAPQDTTRHRAVDSRLLGAATLPTVLAEAAALLRLQLALPAVEEVCHAH